MSLYSDTAEYKLYMTNSARKFSITPLMDFIHIKFFSNFKIFTVKKKNIYLYLKTVLDKKVNNVYGIFFQTLLTFYDIYISGSIPTQL